ncbi:DNA mismatch repair endonuclease MutL [Patescibacteria group bacterium]|nr:DNA mismatch repair endonuclease MutL [Patescibacteria group bacterium]
MRKGIKKLKPEVVKKIAAGQVVEDAASVLKELVENSLDAYANNIVVEIRGGGMQSIKVIDDGVGMSADDLKLCFQPHTTSKITRLEDLTSLRTLGFRGEALASICSVSKVRIRSKVEDEECGKEIYIEEGKLVNEKEIGMPVGTLAEVTDLFSNVPARRKLLKKENSANTKVLNSVLPFVISNSEVGFKLYQEGSLLFNFSPGHDLMDRLIEYLGEDKAVYLIPITNKTDAIHLSGYISKPQAGVKDVGSQLVFVNNRLVTYNVVNRAVRESYNTLLEQDKNPPFVLFLNIAPDLLDVNVHPRKEKVIFWDDAEVYDFVFNSVSECLQTNDLVYRMNSGSDTDVLQEPISKYMYESLKKDVNTWVPGETSVEIVQMFDTFIVTSTQEGLLLVDQHSAHESILFDQYTEYFNNLDANKDIVFFEKPFLVNLSAPLYEVFKNNKDLLKKIGFEIEDFGKRSLRIHAAPKIYKDHNLSVLVEELLYDIKDFGKIKSIDEKSKKTLMTLACRNAIKAGQRLSTEEMLDLVSKLGESSRYYTCPHGRPAKVLLTLKDLEKLFKR